MSLLNNKKAYSYAKSPERFHLSGLFTFSFIVFLGSLHVKILVTVVELHANFRFETEKIVDAACLHLDQQLALCELEEVLAFLKFLHDGE